MCKKVTVAMILVEINPSVLGRFSELVVMMWNFKEAMFRKGGMVMISLNAKARILSYPGGD